MTHNIDFTLASSERIEAALGRRLEEIRLSRNITQSRLAEQAGVSRSTVTRLAQEGKGISLDSFIRIMQALGLQSHLEALLPDPGISPVEQLERKSKPRKRARHKKPRARKWEWDDQDAEQ